MLHQADFVTLKLRSAFDGCGLFEPSIAQFMQVVSCSLSSRFFCSCLSACDVQAPPMGS